MLKCSLWNVCSMNNKLPDIMEHICDRNSDVVFLTETWLKSEKCSITADVKNYGYIMRHNIRKNPDKERGGGVGVLIKQTLSSKTLQNKEFTSFEYNTVKLQLMKKKSIILISI